jgi:hypothetical protein
VNKVDYSDRAITTRIRQVSQLRKLCLSLAKAKPIDPKIADEKRFETNGDGLEVPQDQ